MRSAQARWIVAAVAAGFSCANIAAATITPVAVGGKPAPGVNGNFGNISSFHLNDAGLVSVRAAAGSFTGIWGGTPTSLQLHVRDGLQAPGFPQGWLLEQLQVNADQNIASDGRIAFGASARDPVADKTYAAMYVGPLGSPALVARQGGPAHGVPDATYNNPVQLLFFSNPESGRIVFGNNLAGPGIDASNSGGLWEGPTNSPAPLFRAGQQAPGLPDGILWSSAFGGGRSSPNGNISFEGGVTGPGVTTQTAYVRYVGTFSNPKLIFRAGIPAPGTAPGVVFNQADSEFIHPNNEGNENLVASLAGPGVTQANDEGYWFGNGESLPLVAREGSQAPGLPAGTLFTTLNDTTSVGTSPFDRRTFNNHSDVACSAHFTGPGTDGRGLWAGAIGNLKLIVKDGDQVPGFAPNVLFGGTIGTTRSYSQISLNDNGLLAFLAGTSSGKLGLFGADGAGNIGYIIGTGDLLPIGGGQSKTVDDLDISELNTLNQVAFTAHFTDGTNGAFIASVPEPSAALIAIAAALPLLARRRH
jgi:hypothetical protein